MTRSRKIAVLTTGRQDWGILRSTCVAFERRDEVDLQLLAGGMHLSERFGRTVDVIRSDGFEPAAELEWIESDPVRQGADGRTAAMEASRAVAAVGTWLRDASPDALVLAGDRYETAAAA